MKNRPIILFACLYGIVMPFGMDLYIAALPNMAETLKITSGTASSLSFYMLLGVSSSILFYGPLSDKIGRKPILLYSLLIAAFGCLLSAITNNIVLLILSRIITGIGSGGAPVIARTMLSDKIHDPIQFTQGLSWYAMASSLSPALAPVIGGFIFVLMGWRANFVFLAIFNLIIFGLSYLYLPETISQKTVVSYKNTLINYIKLLKDKSFLIYAIAAGLIWSFNLLYYAVSPFLYQHYFKFTALSNSFLYWISAACIMLGTGALQRLIMRVSRQKILYHNSILFFIISLSILIFAIFHLKSAALFLALICLSAFIYGILSPGFMSASLSKFHDCIGTASSLQAFFRVAITAIIGIIVTLMHEVTILAFAVTLVIIATIIFILILIEKFW